MIVLSEATNQLKPSASRLAVDRSTEAARLVGVQVYTMPPDFSVCETAENALWHIPHHELEQAAFWIGYIPEPKRYQSIYEAALKKRIRLINTPEEHLRAMEFHRFYPLLGNLTPHSLILTSSDDCVRIQDELGYPVFIKGTIQSRKHDGWDVCVAANQAEAVRRVDDLLRRDIRSRGRVIVRKLVPLRYIRYVGNGFPAGREFRVFLLSGEVVEIGYYWDDPDELSCLSQDENEAICTLALEAVYQLKVPYMTVDIGQLNTGEWIVIEVGDAQFAGLSQISPLRLWSRLKKVEVPNS
ncbi:MAG: ATP-grasp domain-containing protein [Anaerolineae bacterium]|nr:ATP-grasp domain-containing protein [Anaerolineae bacterium]